jgi:putative hydrolase of the HAD superfamily
MTDSDRRDSAERAERLWDGIDALIVDAVGTLIHPAPSVADAYALAANRQGVELDRGVVKARFTQAFANDESDEHRGPLATDEVVERRRWLRIVSQVLAEVPDRDRAFRELWDHFAHPGSWACYSDVDRLLRPVRARGMTIRIASNFDARLRPIVAGLGPLAGLENALVVSSEVGYRKPHPAFFQALCASVRVPPERILCVGDDIENDVRGASRAGLRAVLLSRSGGDFPSDVATVAGLDELVAHWPD